MNAAPPLAFCRGEPIAAVPRDLFIPPVPWCVVLSDFEGPLDLLLYLIRKQNLDILHIPLLTVTEQYLVYIRNLRPGDFELAADYLLMAGVLLALKADMLLPVPPPAVVTDDIDAKAELVRRLLVYEQIKTTAAALAARPRAGRDFMWLAPVALPTESAPGELAATVLQSIWQSLSTAAGTGHNKRELSREKWSVSRQGQLLLTAIRQGRILTFQEFLLLMPPDTVCTAVSFIALLELVKRAKIKVSQTAAAAAITLTLA